VKPELLTSRFTLESMLNEIAEPKPGSESKSASKPEGSKPTEQPADQVVAAVRTLNVKLEPAATETATTQFAAEQRADLRQHLPDGIGKLQRLAEPVGSDATDLAAGDEG
jgi:hypothetical protein